MSNADIERATTSTADMVAAGLEQHARAITARVIQLLAEDRKGFLDDLHSMRDMVAAVAIELGESRRESKTQRAEMLNGIHGLQLQLGESPTLDMVRRNEQRIAALEAWRATVEAQHDGT